MTLDPDCRDGKHQSCVGGPCECSCHVPIDCGFLSLPWDLQDEINAHAAEPQP